jgi:hypothetical protein
VRKAFDSHEQGLAIHRESSDRLGEGQILFNLSLAHEKVDDLPSAMACAESALKIYTAIESPNAEPARKRLEDPRQKAGQS